MDTSEQVAYRYLLHRGFKTVVYEPDGNIPPDFLADGRVAVEVRRLNLNESSSGNKGGLEKVRIRLMRYLPSLLQSLGPPTSGVSWFVSIRFRRPVERWKVLRPILSKHLEAFRDGPQNGPTSVRVSKDLELRVSRATNPHPTLFVFGGSTDRDSGGWLMPELEKNLRFCIGEKALKISPVRYKYPEWWLVLVDRIGYGLDDFDRVQFRGQVRVEHGWDKVILLDPANHERAFEI